MNNYNFDDFTEENYRILLKLTKKKWQFIDFPSYQTRSRACLWRHDIDFSVQRAYRLAEIEFEENVKATYFVNLHSCFYNALEIENINLIKRIIGFGHYLGLHFDAAAYPNSSLNINWLVEKITNEVRILENFFEVSIKCFSFHNPGIWNAMLYDDDEIAGLVNAYGKTIRNNFIYITDSNGYWRYQRLFDVLEKAEAQRLHILTHDAWWQKIPMSPNERVRRCINGRAEKVWITYEETLRSAGRKLVE